MNGGILRHGKIPSLNMKCWVFIEAMDHVAKVMKNPKDILPMDLDNEGKWRIVAKEQIDETTRG